jgi:excisionase family DNA binding protein
LIHAAYNNAVLEPDLSIEFEDEAEGFVLDSLEASADASFEPLLGVEEAAELLRIHPKTLQALARSGRVPCARMGKYWRFRKSALDSWVTAQIASMDPVTAREMRGATS